MATKLLLQLILFLMLAVACKGDRTSSTRDSGHATKDGATISQQSLSADRQQAASDESRAKKVRIASVSTAWCLVTSRALDRLRIDSEGRWASDAVTYELWVPETSAVLAATVLRNDSKHNGYSVDWDPPFADTQASEDVSPDAWEKYNWTEGVECTEGPYKVRVEIEDFDPSDHKIEWQEEGGDIAKIDGIEVLGVGRAVPVRRIGGVTLLYAKKVFDVDKTLWRDCYAPHISNSALDLPGLSVRQVSGGVDVEVWGADGASGYKVVWHLRTDGKHSRTLFFP